MELGKQYRAQSDYPVIRLKWGDGNEVAVINGTAINASIPNNMFDLYTMKSVMLDVGTSPRTIENIHRLENSFKAIKDLSGHID